MVILLCASSIVPRHALAAQLHAAGHEVVVAVDADEVEAFLQSRRLCRRMLPNGSRQFLSVFAAMMPCPKSAALFLVHDRAAESLCRDRFRKFVRRGGAPGLNYADGNRHAFR